MNLATFLAQLHHHGEITLLSSEAALDTAPPASDTGVVSHTDDESPAEPTESLESIITAIDHQARQHGPDQLPDLNPSTLRWAATILYDICRFIAFREIEADTVVKGLSQACPGETNASVIYSVDLLLRHLPDCYALAQGLSHDDPLVKEMLRLANEWPLSSIGIQEAHPVNLSIILAHPALRRLYVDRVIERQDRPRASDPHLYPYVQATLGLHAERFAAKLAQLQPADATATPSE